MIRACHLTVQGYSGTPEDRARREILQRDFSRWDIAFCTPEMENDVYSSASLEALIDYRYETRYALNPFYDFFTFKQKSRLLLDIIEFSKHHPNYPIALIEWELQNNGTMDRYSDYILYEIQANRCIAEMWQPTDGKPRELND